MLSLIIGKKGFLSKYMHSKNFENTFFIDQQELHRLDKKIKNNVKNIVLTSFNNKWREHLGYDSSIEKKILKTFKTNDLTLNYLSTSKVYPNDLNICEEYNLDPNSIYAENKIIGENFIRNNFENFKIFRTSNLFNSSGGARQTFFASFLDNLKENKILFDVSENSLRDFVPLTFVASVLNSRMVNIESGIYNLSSNIPIKIKEIIDVIIKNNNIDRKKLNISFGKKIVNQSLNNSKIIKAYRIDKISKISIMNQIGEIDAK